MLAFQLTSSEFITGRRLLRRHDVRLQSVWSVWSWSGGAGAIAACFQRFSHTNSESTGRHSFKTSISCLKFYTYTPPPTLQLTLQLQLFCSLYFVLSGKTEDTTRDIFAIKNGIFHFTWCMLNPLSCYNFSVCSVFWSSPAIAGNN